MPRKILLLNCGSSSIKYQMIDMADDSPETPNGGHEVLATGLIAKIGDAGIGSITHTVDGVDHEREEKFDDHTAALDAMVAMFDEFGPNLFDAAAVGHRTVHGGKRFAAPTIINEEVIAILEELYGLAPLHNPPGVMGIRAAMKVLPEVPHVAIFDTAFFSDLPAEAYTYAIDTEVAEQLAIRKYGFHGTSHQYVSEAVASYLGRDLGELKQIVCHLGNGASISAIDGGRPIDTSMGLTPLQGLVMGTRPGDVDPGLHAYLNRELGWDINQIDTFLNKKSGMLGLTGKTDMRDVLALIEAGDERAIIGAEVYVHRLVSYIGSYWALLGGLDVLTFTAGVGENAAWVRERVLNRLAALGIVMDAEANAERSKKARTISSPESQVTVLVVPTNEELAMARQTLSVINSL